MKYCIHPGRVVSMNDGDVHYISGDKLIRLYRLDPRECRIRTERTGCLTGPDVKHLGPRRRGDYTVPAWVEQYEHHKPLDDGTFLVMFLITFGRLRIAIAPDEYSLGEHW